MHAGESDHVCASVPMCAYVPVRASVPEGLAYVPVRVSVSVCASAPMCVAVAVLVYVAVPIPVPAPGHVLLSRETVPEAVHVPSDSPDSTALASGHSNCRMQRPGARERHPQCT